MAKMKNSQQQKHLHPASSLSRKEIKSTSASECYHMNISGCVIPPLAENVERKATPFVLDLI